MIAREPAARRRAGKLETAVRRDLRSLPKVESGSVSMRATLVESALVLARAIDERGSGTPATTLAKLVEQLRVTLTKAMAEAASDSDGDDAEKFASDMASPVRDPADPG